MLDIIKRVILFFLFSAIIFAANIDQAYIQVVSEPDVSVFLNDIFQGETSEDIGGLIIENVSSGSHSIKCVKNNYEPQKSSVKVMPGEVLVYQVEPFQAKIDIVQYGHIRAQKIQLCVQELKIQSLPVSINISIPALKLESVKEEDIWNAKNIPVGDYELVFTWNDKSLTYTASLNENYPTHLLVDMIHMKVDDRSKIVDSLQTSTVDTSLQKTSFKQGLFDKMFAYFLLCIALMFMFIPIVYIRNVCKRFDNTIPGFFPYLINLSYYISLYRRLEYNAYISRISPRLLIILSMIMSVALVLLAFII